MIKMLNMTHIVNCAVNINGQDNILVIAVLITEDRVCFYV